MPIEAIHELGEVEQQQLENQPQKEYTPEIRDLLNIIDARLSVHLLFKNKINEGQQALIFKIDAQKFEDSSEVEGQKKVEDYLPESKSIKVLKITSQQMAANEFKWHDKVYGLHEQLAEDKKSEYAKIPKPILTHTLEISEDIRERLNKQNADLATDSASVILMDWVEGEDLLTKLFRLYLSDRPGYEYIAKDEHATFGSLLLSVSSDFRNRGLDFDAMDTLEQYKKLLQAVTKNGHQLLSANQKKHLTNTIRLMHQKDVYHNDLHLRNVIVGEDDEVYLIDFGRSESKPQPFANTIDDNFLLNLLAEYKLDSELEKQSNYEIESDIKRLCSKDQSTQAIQSSMKKMSETELIKFLNIDASQWRLDSWRVRRIVAAAYAVKETNPDRAHLITEHLKTKRSELQVESVKVINWLDKQI